MIVEDDLDTTFHGALKLCILGPANVGKTSIRLREYDGIFVSDYVCTIGPEYSEKVREFQLQSMVIKVALWDGPGSINRTSDAKKNALMRGCQGAFVVFDVCNRDSFEQVKEYVRDVRRRAENVLIVLLGNKVDLGAVYNRRVVSEEEATALATKLKCKAYIETSAASGQGIHEAMAFLEQWCVEGIMASDGTAAVTTSPNSAFDGSDTVDSNSGSPTVMTRPAQSSSQLVTLVGQPSNHPWETPVSSSMTSLVAGGSNAAYNPSPADMSVVSSVSANNQSVQSSANAITAATPVPPSNPWSASHFCIASEQAPRRALFARWYPAAPQRQPQLKALIGRLTGEEGDRLLVYPRRGGAPILCAMTLIGADSPSPTLVWRPVTSNSNGNAAVGAAVLVSDIAEIRPPGCTLAYPLSVLAAALPDRGEAKELLFAIVAKDCTVVLGALSLQQVSFLVCGLKMLVDSYVPPEEKIRRGKQSWSQARFVAIRESPPTFPPHAQLHQELLQGIVLKRLHMNLCMQGIVLMRVHDGVTSNAVLWLHVRPSDRSREEARLVLSSVQQKQLWENKALPDTITSNSATSSNSSSTTTLVEWLLFAVGLHSYAGEPLLPTQRPDSGLWTCLQSEANSDFKQMRSLALSDVSEVRVEPPKPKPAGASDEESALSARALFIIGSECTLPLLLGTPAERDALAKQLQALLLFLRPSVALL